MLIPSQDQVQCLCRMRTVVSDCEEVTGRVGKLAYHRNVDPEASDNGIFSVGWTPAR